MEITSESLPKKDFVVLFRTENLNRPQVKLAQHSIHNDTLVAYVSLLPDLSPLSIQETKSEILRTGNFLEIPKILTQEKETSQGEFIFILDRSGSMYGTRIAKAKEALVSFLTQLPDQAFFNVISFGSGFSYMYPSSQPKEKIQDAIDMIETFDADMGGTEILEPVRDVVTSTQMDQSIPRYVFLITDGAVWNSEEVIMTVYAHSAKTRFFSIGIGNGISPQLIQGVAQAGKGDYDFVKDEEDISEKTAYLIRSAISPVLSDIKIDFFPKEFPVLPRPGKIGFIRKNERLDLTLFLDKRFLKLTETGVFLTISYYNDRLKERMAYDLTLHPRDIEENDKVVKLAIHEKIKDIMFENKLSLVNELESEDPKVEGSNSTKFRAYYDLVNEEEVSSYVKSLSTKFQVLCEETAYILVIQENGHDLNEAILPFEDDISPSSQEVFRSAPSPNRVYKTSYSLGSAAAAGGSGG